MAESVQQLLAQAVAAQQAGRLDESERLYRQVLAREPRNAPAWNHLALLLQAMGRFDESAECCRRIIALVPDSAVARNNLGNALAGLRRRDQAIEAYRKAVALRPDYALAHNNLAVALVGARRFDEAIEHLRRAAALAPNAPDTFKNLGNALKETGELYAAADAYQKAIALKNDFAEAYVNLGSTLAAVGRPDQAVACTRRALQIAPGNAEAHSALLHQLHYWYGDQGPAMYREHERWASAHRGQTGMSVLPETDKNVCPTEDRQECLSYRGQTGMSVLPKTDKNVRPTGDRQECLSYRLRIGYVSPDFRRHSVAYFIEPLLAGHDRRHFEVTAYSDVLEPDEITQRLRGYCDRWRDISALADAQVAGQMRDDGIDILVDLAGHTAHNRMALFARRAAPVQVTYLGYPNTTGLAAMDYRLTDASADPPGRTDAWHVEKLLRIEPCFLCYRPSEDSGFRVQGSGAEPGGLDLNPEQGSVPTARSRILNPIAGRPVTFICCNNFAKITPAMMDLWAKILASAPQSRLMLKALHLRQAGARRQVEQFFAQRGIGPDRLELLGHDPSMAAHLARYGQADIALDTYPYNGATTTCEALWMGVPVVNLAGPTHVSRVGLSLLRAIGLGDMVATTGQEYLRLAVQLAGDAQRLAESRATLRTRMERSCLLDERSFARKVEEAFVRMSKT